MRFRPSIVVVAAGRGSRFRAAVAGAPVAPSGAASAVSALPGEARESELRHREVRKLEQPFAASTVLGTTVRNAVQSQLPVVVVTVASLEHVAAAHLARRDIVVIDDDEAAGGMGHSIALGVAERSGAPGWLVLPADMPLVQPGTLLAVATALENHAVAYAQHRGRRGHPVGFASELYSELVLLKGDEGARRIVARYPAHPVEVNDPGVLIDIDTPADLDAARSAAAALPVAPA